MLVLFGEMLFKRRENPTTFAAFSTTTSAGKFSRRQHMTLCNLIHISGFYQTLYERRIMVRSVQPKCDQDITLRKRRILVKSDPTKIRP